MLQDLDESLHHQTSRPMRLAATTDQRFYDRYWFEAVSSDTSIMVIAGIAIYRNTGMCDGFMSVQHQMRQTNVRLARPLGDDLSSTVGPLTVEVVAPFQHLAITLAEGDQPISAHLHWRSAHAPHLEKPTVRRNGDSLVQDSIRYDQLGQVSGWIELEGRRFEAADWWSVRDHSWGVRPGVGGVEVPAVTPEASLHLWTYASAGDTLLHFQVMEDGIGTVAYLDGAVVSPATGEPDAVTGVEHDIVFIDGSREWSRSVYTITTASGRTIKLEAEAAQRAWAYRGAGYATGYNDRRGLGASRPLTSEWDVLDLRTPGHVRRDGEPYPPGHREQPARVRIDGVPGFAHVSVMTSGTIPRYGLAPRPRPRVAPEH